MKGRKEVYELYKAAPISWIAVIAYCLVMVPLVSCGMVVYWHYKPAARKKALDKYPKLFACIIGSAFISLCMVIGLGLTPIINGDFDGYSHSSIAVGMGLLVALSIADVYEKAWKLQAHQEQLEKDYTAQLKSNSGDMLAESNKYQLNYEQMLAIADVLECWISDLETNTEHTANVHDWAKDFRALAKEVGKDWAPSEPQSLSIIGLIARL